MKSQTPTGWAACSAEPPEKLELTAKQSLEVLVVELRRRGFAVSNKSELAAEIIGELTRAGFQISDNGQFYAITFGAEGSLQGYIWFNVGRGWNVGNNSSRGIVGKADNELARTLKELGVYFHVG